MAIKVSGTEVISDDKRILNNESLPDIRPSLLLDFANSKTLDPRITFTRGSTATYWDGKTTAKAEENLVTYSQELDQQSTWQQVRLNVTADDIVAPDGTTTADKLVCNTSTTGGVYVQTDVNVLGNNTIAVSVYAKVGSGGDHFALTFYDGGSNGCYQWYDVSAGTVGTSTTFGSNVTVSSASITDVGNGWYRLIMIVDYAISDTSAKLQLRAANNQDAVSEVSVGDYGYVWGAQLEQRSSATAYTPTTSSPIVKYQPVLQTAASGEARFDHDPVTGESKGLLIEEARTNLVLNSTDPTATNMTSIRSASAAIAAIAPDGTFTARKHTSDATSTGEHYFSATYTPITSGNTYTASFYIKDAGVGYAYIKVYNAFPDTAITVDLSDKTVNTLTPQTFSAISVTDVGNDWYRISVTKTADTTSSTQSVLFGYTTSSTTGAFLGDGYKGAFIWGMQIEEGSFPTSYIPTSGSTVTRAKDFAKFFYDDSGWNQQESTIYADVTIEHGLANSFPRILEVNASFILSGQDVNNLVYFQSSVIGEYPTVNSAANAFTLGRHKVAVSFENHVGFSLSIDGDLDTQSGVNFRVPTPSGRDFMILSNTADNRYLSGYISKLAIYPKRLPNATLQAMTEE